MNNLFYSVLITVFFAGLLPFNTALLLQDDHTNKITEAIKKGDADALSDYFSASIDLKIPGSEGTFSKNQATVLLKEFFSSDPPGSFELGHKGSSQDGSLYVIGHMKTSQGKNYRTYILLKNISGKMVMHQLQFDSR